MAFPVEYRNGDQVKTGPGIILFAPEGTAVPTLTAAGGVFTNSFSGWRVAGYTDEGCTFTFGRDTEDVEVAEENLPVRKVTTKTTGTVEVSLATINQENLKVAMAGGSWSTSGTGASTVSKYSPPAAGTETRVMIAHIGQDSDEILIIYKAFQSGEVSIARQKGANKASLSGLKFDIEIPDTDVSVDPWNYYTAGTWANANAVEA